MAASQPGSRAGLITTLVISLLAMFVFAFLWWQKANDAEIARKGLADFKKSAEKVVTESELTSARPPLPFLDKAPAANDTPEMKKLRQRYAGKSYYSILVDMNAEKDKALDQAGAYPPVEAVAAKVQAISDKLKVYGVSLPGSIFAALDPLTDKIVAQANEIDQLKAQVQQLNNDVKAEMAKIKPIEDKYNGMLADEAKKLQQTLADKAALEQAQAKAIADLKADAEKKAADLLAANQALDDSRKKAESETGKFRADNEALVRSLAKWRPQNLAESALRQPDGNIWQIGKNNVVYINLGLGDQMYKGMTFEVYDKSEGVPRVSAVSEEQLPAGKASIEVINVGPGSSECRIVKLEPGQTIQVGDVVANLIYDRHVKWTFKIYGDFDIDGDGRATVAEAEVLKRRVAEWGGRVTDQINCDTDFVVMGKEPEMPRFTAEERKNPINDYEAKKAEQQIKEYDDVRRKAMELHIPVLNQNRFLYLIGYYDQARR